MTSLDKDGVTVHSIGNQIQSSRTSSPSYTISSTGRAAREAVYVSEMHSRSAKLGRTHPKGAVYDLPSTLSTRGCGFAPPKSKPSPGKKSYAHELYPAPADGGPICSGDILGNTVDSQPVKYERAATMVIGTQPRGQLKDAELLKSHSAAFVGRESPGPAAPGEDVRAQFQGTKPKLAWSAPFAGKAKGDWLASPSGTPSNLGPGTYPRKDPAIGPQHLSKRKSAAAHAVPQAERFQKSNAYDIISKYDVATSSFGKQVMSRSKTAPGCSFGTSTRDGRSSSAMCFHQLDRGPKASLPKRPMSQPNLPLEKNIMASGIG
eukprot:gnl/TRDRNA2_/TRDRNA2_93559_c0_seq1.p1 gnl/TRDRNA2_/TRDRNA2_93559_c0~~gnl/TRDRNA2_/TRDRNA2_93559_c0_seq1.p1  ORF type:complete len:319 (+),score=43.11 gnl/TRDRNA2_/TRDRNA2_93559_c0_seq1:65-1021(+)